jgi:hypothetical protein
VIIILLLLEFLNSLLELFQLVFLLILLRLLGRREFDFNVAPYPRPKLLVESVYQFVEGD